MTRSTFHEILRKRYLLSQEMIPFLLYLYLITQYKTSIPSNEVYLNLAVYGNKRRNLMQIKILYYEVNLPLHIFPNSSYQYRNPEQDLNRDLAPKHLSLLEFETWLVKLISYYLMNIYGAKLIM